MIRVITLTAYPSEMEAAMNEEMRINGVLAEHVVSINTHGVDVSPGTKFRAFIFYRV